MQRRELRRFGKPERGCLPQSTGRPVQRSHRIARETGWCRTPQPQVPRAVGSFGGLGNRVARGSGGSGSRPGKVSVIARATAKLSKSFRSIGIRCVEARFVDRETGPWSELCGSGNRRREVARLEGNFEMSEVGGPARRSGNRASWVVSRQTHPSGNRVMRRWTRQTHRSSQATGGRVERQTRRAGNRVSRAWTRRNGFRGALRKLTSSRKQTHSMGNHGVGES